MNTISKSIKVLTLVISISWGIPSYSLQLTKPSNKNLKHKIQNALDSIYNKDEDFGGATLGVVLSNEKHYQFAVGFANMQNKQPMSTRHMMLGGSTGKIFVSASIMQLVQQQKINLDDKVLDYFKNEKWFSRLQNYDSITIRNLMQHSSGISRYVFTENFLTDVTKHPDKIWTPQELLSYVFDMKPLFVPGTDFAYSDTNYIILAMVLEKITGLTMYDYIKANILDKHDLQNIIPQISRSIKNLPIGYNSDNDPFYPGIVITNNNLYRYNVQFEWAGGGYVMSALDLARAGKLIYENKVFSEDLMTDFLKGIDAKELGGKWGLGVHITETPYGIVYGHSGFFPGYITNMIYFPEKKLAIAFQINVSDREKLSLYRKLYKMIPIINKLVTDA